MTLQHITVDERPNAGIALERPSDLPMGVAFSSSTGKARFVFQYDGNLVDYDENNAPRWESRTANDQRPAGDGGKSCSFQQDGNLVVYDAGSAAVFSSNTADDQQGGNGGRVLIIQDDGNVVIYNAGGVALWSTNANH